MFDESRLPFHPWITLSGRILFTLIFFLSGVTHFTDIEGYVSLMHEAIPFRTFWVLISGVVELVGATLVLFDRSARTGAWLIVLFLLPVTLTVHGYEMISAESAEMRAIQLSFFLKGLAMMGGALLISQLGARHPATNPAK
jgi:putative oxidoreductase